MEGKVGAARISKTENGGATRMSKTEKVGATRMSKTKMEKVDTKASGGTL